jgi:5'-nucleotidase/UDP-sugar diphosphatase
MKSPFLVSLLSCLILFACDTQRQTTTTAADDDKIEVILLHMNDVYEIAPLEGGKRGGMARVAALEKQLKAENPLVLTVHAGDFLSPSLLGTLKYEGNRIKGRQMVEVMNAMDIDLVTFGNHEFDIDEEELQQRLNESNFPWVGTTVRQATADGNQPFHKEVDGTIEPQPDTWVWEVTDEDGTSFRLGFFGATLGSNPKPYVKYLDVFRTVPTVAADLHSRADVVVGLTHLELVDDKKLATLVKDVPLFMGGHDHDNSIDTVGNTVIAKADANVKSVYIHRIQYDKKTDEVTLLSEWMPITDELSADPEIDKLVEKWLTIQDENIRQVVDDPYEIVYHTDTPLDGRESSIRNENNSMGTIITQGMRFAGPVARTPAALFNSGGVRLDDQLSGAIQAIDWFRTLPFGGAVWEVEIEGGLLVNVLNIGRQNKGTGGFLQYDGIEYIPASKSWNYAGQPIEKGKTYRVAMNDFLLSGLETRLDFLTPDNPGIISVTKPAEDDPRSDIRKAIIQYLKTR